MKKQKIAIVGAGTAGMVASLFLKKQGHEITIFEKFDRPKPLGAGLLLQPTGLSVLSVLGLDKKIIDAGSKIYKMYGKEVNTNIEIINTRYSSIKEGLFGVGTHRGNLFSFLYNEVLKHEIQIITSTSIAEIKDLSLGLKSKLIDEEGKIHSEFDIIIDASGSNSFLRKKYADIKLDKKYPYGALWSIVKDHKGLFSDNRINQRFKSSNHMIGILPVGTQEGNDCQSLAFFWSIKLSDIEKWKREDINIWKKYVISLWPELDYLVDQFSSHNDLTIASYRDVILKKYYTQNLIFIGDASHCTSPQLGQGANLALLDAYFLARAFEESESLDSTMKRYMKYRKGNIKFYQMASRYLTPFFQSDSKIFPFLRYFTCAVPCAFPPTQKYGARVLSGTKTGIFSYMNPGDWAEDYSL
jgi:2-polyprenyl-6-methoxyphenol hydroxylase-like FAD-dependent oxidoreductase